MIIFEQWSGRLQVFRYVTEAEAAEVVKERDAGKEKEGTGEPKPPVTPPGTTPAAEKTPGS